MSKETPKLYGPEAAAEYLRQKWGLESFTVDAFRQHRYRLRKANRLEPSPFPELPNSSVWTKEQLDAFPAPDTTKRRHRKRQNPDDKEDLDKESIAVLSFA